MLLLLILGFLLIIALEVPPMAARGQKGEWLAFWVLLGLGFALSVAVAQRWPIPNPMRFLEAVFRPAAALMGIQ